VLARAWLSIFGLLAVVSWLGCDAVSHNDHPLVGHKAPLFTAAMLDERPFDLAQHVGQNVVILDFWSTWCGPCTRSLPTLCDVAAQYRDRGVEFFAVDIGETPDDVRRFLESSSLDLTVVMDPDGAISDLYQVEPIPHTVIIGIDGKVRFVHVGASQNLRAELIRELDKLVAGQPSAGLPARQRELARRSERAL
jgi:peroxiredoxin